MQNPALQAVRVIPYAGEALRVLGECSGLAVCELTGPAVFAGPPLHVHHDFDEAIYVRDGSLTMIIGRHDPQPAPAGSLILAARGIRHTFANPNDEPVRVLDASTSPNSSAPQLDMWPAGRATYDLRRLPPTDSPDASATASPTSDLMTGRVVTPMTAVLTQRAAPDPSQRTSHAHITPSDEGTARTC